MISHTISLRVSVTGACPLRCQYCRAVNEASPSGIKKRFDTRELINAIALLSRVVRIDKIRFTGGEPLIRPDLTALVASCAKLGIPDLSMTTNGQLLAGVAASLRRAGLERINISLDSLNPKTYSDITRGGNLADALSGIEAALLQRFDLIKLNMVLMRGINDHEAPELLDYAMSKGCRVRFLELMPIGTAAAHFNERFVPSSETCERLANRFTLTPLAYKPGETSRDFLAEDRRGRTAVCGFISPSSQPFCGGCRRLRLTEDGLLLGCLARLDRFDLRPALEKASKGDMQPLTEAVEMALMLKLQPRDLAQQSDMEKIGG